jgi:hypothetical protein
MKLKLTSKIFFDRNTPAMGSCKTHHHPTCSCIALDRDDAAYSFDRMVVLWGIFAW